MFNRRLISFINLPISTKTIAPINNGKSRKDQLWAVSIISIGLAPAGGCVVLVNNISVTPSPAAIAKLNAVTPTNSTKVSPIKAVIKCPKIITALAPKGAISNISPEYIVSEKASTPIEIAAPMPAKSETSKFFILLP